MSGESQRSFVDTNVLIYAHDATAGVKHDIARQLIAELGNLRTGRLSLQVLQEFFVNVTRKIPNPISVPQALKIVSDFGVWRCHEPDLEDVLAAGQIHDRTGVSFWDAMIIRSAHQTGCSVIWTEDLSDGQSYEGVRAANPFSNN